MFASAARIEPASGEAETAGAAAGFGCP